MAVATEPYRMTRKNNLWDYFMFCLGFSVSGRWVWVQIPNYLPRNHDCRK